MPAVSPRQAACSSAARDEPDGGLDVARLVRFERRAPVAAFGAVLNKCRLSPSSRALCAALMVARAQP